MSNPYTQTRLPDCVSVRCPNCEGHAQFEYASYVGIKERKDIGYFEASDHFTYVTSTDSYNAMKHLAVYYHGLNGNTLHTISDLPDGYETEHWTYTTTWGAGRMYRYLDHGVLACPACHLRRKHVLKWPDDAWFQVTYRGQTLWAFDRDSATSLLAFVSATDRKLKHFSHNKFLLKVPAHFLSAKARGPVVKKLSALLDASH